MDRFEHAVKRRVISGVRWSLILNLLTMPLSFLTSAILGNFSATTLGYYGAIQLFISVFQMFFVLGAPRVFPRFVPGLESNQRLPFLVSVTVIGTGVVLSASAVAFSAFPQATGRALARLGGPTVAQVLGLSAGILILSFGSNFLFGILRGPWAAASQRIVPIGFFLAAALGFGSLRGPSHRDPAAYLWNAAVVSFAVAAVLVVVLSVRESDLSFRPREGWFLPKGFWPVVFYSQAAALVTFVYTSFSPFLVLAWLDVSALGHFHAATRFQVLLRMFPALLAAVLAPGLSRLDSAGQRPRALGQASSALRASIVPIVPVSLALILFSSDAMTVFGNEFRAYGHLLAILAVSFMAGPAIHIGVGILTALGAFRSYLAASMFYVVSAAALTLLLVPLFGLTGAALATTAGAFAQQVLIDVVLRRRLGFRMPGRVYLAFLWCSVACLATLVIAPERLTSALLLIVLQILFLWTARVTPSEIHGLIRQMLGRP